MIKLLFTFICSIASVVALAQTDSLAKDSLDTGAVITAPAKNNEWKVNFLMTLSGLPEFAYERIVKHNVGVGLSILVRLDKGRDYNLGFLPYYRYYLGKKRASGLFIEGNTAIYSIVNYERWLNATERNNYAHHNEPSTIELGLGMAAGAKFIERRFFGEISLGMGRFLTKTHFKDYPGIDFSFGKRF